MIHNEKNFGRKKNFKKLSQIRGGGTCMCIDGGRWGWVPPWRKRELTAPRAIVEQLRRAWNISTAPPSPLPSHQGVPRCAINRG